MIPADSRGEIPHLDTTAGVGGEETRVVRVSPHRYLNEHDASTRVGSGGAAREGIAT